MSSLLPYDPIPQLVCCRIPAFSQLTAVAVAVAGLSSDITLSAQTVLDKSYTGSAAQAQYLGVWGNFPVAQLPGDRNQTSLVGVVMGGQK